jgi:hypothetical protein
MVERGKAKKEAENGAAVRLRQLYPTIEDLRARARRRVPRFGFDFVDGGANEEYCIDRNISAFQSIELLPRYCIEGKATTDTELFGRTYAAPIGVAPMGSAGLMWPGAEKLFAAEAQRSRIPYVLRRPAMPRSRRSPQSRRTCSGFSSTALPTTTTPSLTTWYAAPTKPARTCWCRPSTRPASRSGRAISVTAAGCRFRSTRGPPGRC